MRAAVLVALVMLAGCSTVVYKPVRLPLEPRPTLPAVSPDALQCLAPAVYTDLVTRERLLRTWGLSNEATIKANNDRAGDH